MRRLKHYGAARPTCNHATLRCLAPPTATIKRATLRILSQPCLPGKTAALLAWECRRTPAGLRVVLSCRLQLKSTLKLDAASLRLSSPAQGIALLRSQVRIRFDDCNGYLGILMDQISTGEAVEGIAENGGTLRLCHSRRP